MARAGTRVWPVVVAAARSQEQAGSEVKCAQKSKTNFLVVACISCRRPKRWRQEGQLGAIQLSTANPMSKRTNIQEMPGSQEKSSNFVGAMSNFSIQCAHTSVFRLSAPSLPP